MGELGEDHGGPCRELWRLLGMAIKTSLCHGPDCNKTLLHNSGGLKVKYVCIIIRHTYNTLQLAWCVGGI